MRATFRRLSGAVGPSYTRPMPELVSFAGLAFASLFTMVNPLGVVSIFGTLTAGLGRAQARGIAYRAIAASLAILLLVALGGQALFGFFSITVDDLRLVGGVIFFVMGYDMLLGRIGRTKDDGEPEQEYAQDIAITPLAIPVICGPGAITSAIIFASDADGVTEQAVLVGVIGVVLAITLLTMLFAERILRTLGMDARRVLLRLMGLIVMAIAVEFFFAGLTPHVRAMLAAT